MEEIRKAATTGKLDIQDESKSLSATALQAGEEIKREVWGKLTEPDGLWDRESGRDPDSAQELLDLVCCTLESCIAAALCSSSAHDEQLENRDSVQAAISASEAASRAASVRDAILKIDIAGEPDSEGFKERAVFWVLRAALDDATALNSMTPPGADWERFIPGAPLGDAWGRLRVDPRFHVVRPDVFNLDDQSTDVAGLDCEPAGPGDDAPSSGESHTALLPNADMEELAQGAKQLPGMVDPRLWVLPNPRRAIDAIRKSVNRNPDSLEAGRGSHHVLALEVAPVDLYAYLKSRFGNPNGFAMTLRNASVDNLIHWQYTLECPETILDVTSIGTRTEVLAYDLRVDEREWSQLEMNLQELISRNRKYVHETKSGLERWRLFVNPYKRLSQIVARCESRLKEIEIPRPLMPSMPATRAAFEAFHDDLGSAMSLAQEAMELCVTLDMVTPVMGEAAVNFLMMMLAKPEIRNDKRMREDFSRRAIDVRIKSLPVVCEGFARGVSGSEGELKEFLKMMNQRNEALHGNINPRERGGDELYFDCRTIPLRTSNKPYSEMALSSILANLNIEESLRRVRVVRDFVEFLFSLLKADAESVVRQAIDELELGFRARTGSIGIVLPRSLVDLLPVKREEEEGI